MQALDIVGKYSYDSIANEAWIEALPQPAHDIHLPPGSHCAQLHTWLRQHGGIDADWSDIDIVFHAHARVNITVEAARVHLLKTDPSSDKYRLTCVPNAQSYVAQAESLTWPNQMPGGFIVDHDGELATPWINTYINGTEDAFTMTPGTYETLWLTGFAINCTCEWAVNLTVNVNGASRDVLVENGDEPFKTQQPPLFPDDGSDNAVFCDDRSATIARLVPPNPQDCPPPTTYEGTAIY